ncbi:MAG: DUF1192 domain-containing protein [Rhizobiales bacterium]|nr:DUF1192 domain-containing protein [Hyphomicrobiales bacterium]
MVVEDEERIAKPADIVIGEDLSMLSVEELEHRIEMLENEIARIRDDIGSKQSSLSVAESFFKQL